MAFVLNVLPAFSQTNVDPPKTSPDFAAYEQFFRKIAEVTRSSDRPFAVARIAGDRLVQLQPADLRRLLSLTDNGLETLAELAAECDRDLDLLHKREPRGLRSPSAAP